jgi:hypothetical protein
MDTAIASHGRPRNRQRDEENECAERLAQTGTLHDWD